MLTDTLQSFRNAARIWLSLVVVHGFIRLFITAVLVPALGALLAVWLSFSAQSALTDQDIARFLLTPAGALGGLVLFSLVLAAMVLDVAAMTALLAQSAKGPIEALRNSAAFVVAAFPALAVFSVHLIARLVVLAAPFLAAAGLIALWLLTEFDINYYLTNRPPEFLLAAGLIGGVALVMAALLLWFLVGWSVALHLAVLERLPARSAFKESRRITAGHRRKLALRLVGWAIVRGVVLAIVGMLAAVAVSWITDGPGSNFRLVLIGLLVAGGLWLLANTIVSAIANGALADLLYAEYRDGRSATAGKLVMPGEASSKSLLSGANVVLLLTAVVSVGSIGAGGALLEAFEVDREIAVIAHRGASGSRPENTMASIRKAIEDRADWVEIDVQELADGQIIVAHDSDFMKSAGVATKIWNAGPADIAVIDIGSWFDPSYSDQRPPYLRDVLETVKGHANLIVELKYYGHDVDLEHRVISLIESAGMADSVATMSLKYPAVQKMKSLRPDWRTGVLAATSIGNLSGLDGDFLAVNSGMATNRLISQAHSAGKDVYVWTVNEPSMMSRMVSMGVDGLITDYPALARDVISYHKGLPTIGRLLLVAGDWVGTAVDFDTQHDLRP